MKKVVSKLAAPFRAIGRILLRILPLLGKPLAWLRKLTKLRGRKLVFALVPLVALVVLAVIVLKPEADQEQQVRETLDRYAAATRDKDYQELCDELLGSDLLERIRAAGLPCEVALRPKLEPLQNPQLQVLSVEVDGDRASARARTTAVGEPESVDTIQLVREDDGWRVTSLS